MNRRLVTLTASLFRATVLGAGIVLSSGATFAQSSAPSAGAIRTLARAELDTLLAKPEGVLVIDVRRPDEIGAIGGFPAFLSIQPGDIERLIAIVPRDRQIVTVSNHAHRAQQAGARLAARGYRVVGAVGALDYEAQGGTLVGKKAVVAGAAAASTRAN